MASSAPRNLADYVRRGSSGRRRLRGEMMRRCRTVDVTDRLEAGTTAAGGDRMARSLTLIGVPSGAGACGVGQEQAPGALRAAGLIESLDGAGVEGAGFGDGPGIPWAPHRGNPFA